MEVVGHKRKQPDACACGDVEGGPKRARTVTESDAKPSTEAVSMLKRTTLAQFLDEKARQSHGHEPHEVVTIDHTDSISDALKTFAHHKILSAPVVLAASAEDTESGTLLGFLDVGSILKYLIDQTTTQGRTGGTDKNESKSDKKEKIVDFHSLESIAKTFLNTHANVVVGGDVDYVLSLNATMPMFDVVSSGFLQRAKDQSSVAPHVHRLAVFETSGRIANIVSQSDVVRFLLDHLDELGDIRTKTITQLGFAPRAVVCVPLFTPALDAFHTMFHKHVTSVAIVDEKGALLANLSNSDLRGLTLDELKHLDSPVLKFLQSRNFSPSSDKHTGQEGHFSSMHVLQVGPDHTFEATVRTVAKSHLHRAYVVDDHKRPIGIVTLTDILRALIEPVGL